MTVSATKAGTGAGAIVIISATPATLASPAPYPAAPPVAMTLAPATTPTGIAVFQIKEIAQMPNPKWAFDETTNVGSPAVGIGVQKESWPTTVDPGEFSATGVFLPSDPGVIALQTAFMSGLAQSFQVQLMPIAGQSTTGNLYAFTGYVQELPAPTNISAEKVITTKISIKLNSMPTILEGS